MAIIASLVPCAVSAASGDWNVFVNASSVNRITSVGDSIWCATRGGIVVFNLLDSTFVQHLDGLGFKSTDVTGVVRDEGGSVWAGFATSGVARIDGLGSAHPFVKLYSASLDGLMSDSVTCVASLGADIYYGSAKGAAKFYDDVHFYEPILSDSLDGVLVSDLLARGDTLWVACERGVASYVPATFSFTMYRIGAVSALCLHAGAVHCAGSGGVRRFDGAAWTALGSPGGNVPIALASGAGTLYCVAGPNAYRFDGASWVDLASTLMRSMFYQKYTILGTFSVPKTIAVDGRGTLWLAGYEAQVDRGAYLSAFVSGAWINRAQVQLSQNGVVALSLAPGQGIWASTRYFGISYRSNEGLWNYYYKMRTPTDPAGLDYYLNHLGLLRDSHGYLYASCLSDKLDRITLHDPLNKADDEWTHYGLNEGTITTNRFVKAKEDPAGNRWFLSDDVASDVGLYGINIQSADGSSWLSITPATAPGMAGGSVFDVEFGPSGVAYLALRGYGVQSWYTGGYDWATLSSLASDVWNTVVEPEDLESDELYCVERGSDGAVWVGTAAGLVRNRAGVITSYSIKTSAEERGLLGAIVRDLEFDGEGRLWVATDRGLNVIDPTGVIGAYTTADAWRGELYPSSAICPLPSPICTALQFDASLNVLWIGTMNGLARLDVSPEVVEEAPLAQLILYPNPIHISRGDADLKISGITRPVSVQVFTLEGELVSEASGVVDGGTAWDLLTVNGYRARSGIYLVRVSDSRGAEVRKIGVIR